MELWLELFLTVLSLESESLLMLPEVTLSLVLLEPESLSDCELTLS